jgi:hypothetical protein
MMGVLWDVMSCRVICDDLKALQSGKVSGANHSIAQHHIPGTCVFSSNVVRTSNLCKYAFTVLNLLNAKLNPICHLLALLGGATIVVVSKLRVKHQSRTNNL